VLEAAGWAGLAASTLLLGVWLATAFRFTDRVVGLVMGFGAGALIAAVSFELTEEAFAKAGGGPVALGLAGGALTYFAGDRAIDRAGAAGRKTVGRSSAIEGRALLLGATLDAVPESLIIGLSLIGGGSIELAFLVSVAVSNVPEGFASAASQHAAGESTGRIVARWLVVVAISAVCGAIGFLLFDDLAPRAVAFTQAFGAGALLTMVMDTMAPEAYRDAGPATGLVAVAGFTFAFWLGTLS
jgi:ZIP family zinc transporter